MFLKMTDLSVIVLSYNTKDLTIGCVNSVVRYTRGISYEIIVVDNGSTDGSVEKISKLKLRYKDLVAVFSKKNLGFTGGNNLGIKRAGGRYILLLNSDTYLSENTLGKMINFMDENPAVGIATCSLRNPDGTIQKTGGFFPTLPRVFTWMSFLDDVPGLSSFLKLVHPHPESGFFNRDHEQDWITGAFFMIRKEVVDQVGLLDEDYFMYMEDVDYCYRARKKGWKVFYTTKAKITHIGGASGGSENTIISELKNLKLFYKKHYLSWQGAVLSVFIKMGALLRIILFGILLGRRDRLKIYAKAFATV